jgi:anti-sigma B factor antagonist
VALTTMIALTGEIDMATRSALRLEILDSPDEVVVLDASELTFIDSSGLRTLIDSKAFLSADGRRLKIINRPAAFNRLLAMTGLSAEFD